MYKFLDQIVADYMTRNVVTVPPEMTVRELGQLFKETDFNGFPVMQGAQMIGFAVEECRRRGCEIVQLTTDKSRPDAHRFYLSLGFVASHEGMKLTLQKPAAT